MTLQEFIDKYLGKEIDFDGFYGGQCVDLYRQYVKDVLGYPQSAGVGGAAEIWDSASGDYYDFIEDASGKIPSPGDIVVWNRNVGGGFGHVSVCVSSSLESSKFTSFDQNWPTLSVCTLTAHTYTNVIGWMHPKKEIVMDCIVPNTPEWRAKYEEIVGKATKYDGFKTAGYENPDAVEKNITDLNQTIRGLNELITEKNSTLSKNTTDMEVMKKQAEADTMRINSLEDQTKKIPQLVEDNKYLQDQKDKWIESEKTYNRTVSQLRLANEELRKASVSRLLEIIGEQIVEKLKDFVDYMKGFNTKGGVKK